MKKTLFWKCGCEIDAGARVKVTDSSRGIQSRFVCTTHFEPLEYAIMVCECGTIETVTSMHSVSVRNFCKKCSRKKAKEKANKQYTEFAKTHTCTFECGCVTKRKDAFQSMRYGPPKCPEHLTKCVKVTAACLDCGDSFKPAGSFSITRCKNCRQKYGTYNFKGQEIPTRNKGTASTYDCKHRGECIVKYENKKVLPCRACNKYVSAPLNVMNYVKSGDSFAVTGRHSAPRESMEHR